MIELLCALLFGLCSAQQPQYSNLAELLIYGEDTLGYEWRVIQVVDEPTQSIITFEYCCAVVSLIDVNLINEDSERDFFNYVNDEPTFSRSMFNYSPTKKVSSCEIDDVYIAEYVGQFNNTSYRIRHFVEQDNRDFRVTSLFFEDSGALSIEDYAARFFPENYACPMEQTES